MPSLKIPTPMRNPPTSCATEPTDGRFYPSSSYEDYFSFDNPGTTAIDQQGRLSGLEAPGDVYAETTLVNINGNYLPQHGGVKGGMNNYVPLGTQVAWDQGSTTGSSSMDHHSMGMPSPMSQPMSMPLIPGISSSFEPILHTWHMPPVPSKRPPTGGTTSRKGKASAGGEGKKDDNHQTRTRSAAGATVSSISPEDGAVSPNNTAMMNSQDDTPSVTSTSTSSSLQADFRNNNSIMTGGYYTQREQQQEVQEGQHDPNLDSPPSPRGPEQMHLHGHHHHSINNGTGSRLATQRARNRMAANKFRKKSKAAVAELEAVERNLSLQHHRLSMELRCLREEVLGLKNQLLVHGNCNNAVIQNYLSMTARSLSLSGPAAGAGGGGKAAAAAAAAVAAGGGGGGGLVGELPSLPSLPSATSSSEESLGGSSK